MTGARWQSAFVALVFALHPLHVESVACISERKDVLSGFFWFLSLWCYGRYAERPGAGRYVLVLIPFILGLMAKQMVVTLPLVLLLLDVWPLQRTARGYAFLFREKIPFFAVRYGVGRGFHSAAERRGSDFAGFIADRVPATERAALVGRIHRRRVLSHSSGPPEALRQNPL